MASFGINPLFAQQNPYQSVANQGFGNLGALQQQQPQLIQSGLNQIAEQMQQAAQFKAALIAAQQRQQQERMMQLGSMFADTTNAMAGRQQQGNQFMQQLGQARNLADLERASSERRTESENASRERVAAMRDTGSKSVMSMAIDKAAQEIMDATPGTTENKLEAVRQSKLAPYIGMLSSSEQTSPLDLMVDSAIEPIEKRALTGNKNAKVDFVNVSARAWSILNPAQKAELAQKAKVLFGMSPEDFERTIYTTISETNRISEEDKYLKNRTWSQFFSDYAPVVPAPVADIMGMFSSSQQTPAQPNYPPFQQGSWPPIPTSQPAEQAYPDPMMIRRPWR